MLKFRSEVWSWQPLSVTSIFLFGSSWISWFCIGDDWYRLINEDCIGFRANGVVIIKEDVNEGTNFPNRKALISTKVNIKSTDGNTKSQNHFFYPLIIMLLNVFKRQTDGRGSGYGLWTREVCLTYCLAILFLWHQLKPCITAMTWCARWIQ